MLEEAKTMGKSDELHSGMPAFDEAAERVIVALDCDGDRALELAEQLAAAGAVWVKVGMTLFYDMGPRIVAKLKERGLKVFLDLKLFDIPHQVEGAAASAASCGIDLLTVHATGGIPMMEAALRGADIESTKRGIPRPHVIAVTVLTSMGEDDLRQMGVARSVPEQVEALARNVSEAGLDGVVCSPQEAALMREVLGEEADVVTPGVRPAGSAAGDQTRIATPSSAIAAGASHIVVGRPITQAADPAAAFVDIVRQVAMGE